MGGLWMKFLALRFAKNPNLPGWQLSRKTKYGWANIVWVSRRSGNLNINFNTYSFHFFGWRSGRIYKRRSSFAEAIFSWGDCG